MEWLIVYIKRDDQIIKDFVDMIKKCGPQMGMKVGNPKLMFQSDDRTETYLKSLRNGIHQNSQMAVIVFPTARSDKYSAVKKLLCTEIGLSSQVFFSSLSSRKYNVIFSSHNFLNNFTPLYA
jgi:aubergine-like protein